MTSAPWPPRRLPPAAALSAPAPPRWAPDLEALTGIRSGKPSFYPEYRHSAERLRRVILALDQISAALVRTVEGSEALVRAVVSAAAEHLSARWLVFALVDGCLPDAAPRHLVLGPHRIEVADPELVPHEVRGHVRAVRAGDFADDHSGDTRRRHAHVPVCLAERVVGGFAAWTGPDRDIDATDESVLRILAGQTAAALRNCALFQNLARRNVELQHTQEELFAAQQRQVLDTERHRIARELHDSVTQYVISAGMQIEMCRGELADPALRGRLEQAKDLTRRAVERLRSAIYALSEDEQGEDGLPAMLERLTRVHLPDQLRVEVRIGGHPVALPAAAEQSLFRIAGEALFNTAVHADARHALVRLSYRKDRVVLSVSDDGRGVAEEVRRCLRAASSYLSGDHRGLPNMQARARELGGTLRLTRSRLGGLQVQVSVPVAGEDP
jgi:signal transduction histidine kinase